MGQDVLIQEFIEDAKGSDIRAFVVDGEIVGAMVRQALPGEFRSNIHRGATATIAKLSSEEQDIALRATKILGLSVHRCGYFEIEAWTPRIGGAVHPPDLEGIEATTKVDIAGKIISFIEKNLNSSE